MKIVLATHNRDKVAEIRHILDDLDAEIIDLNAFPGAPETVEDGDTLAANALKKAREIRDFTGVSALADDTGLEVDALDGAPGVYSSRFAHENASYDENCDKLLHEMKDVPADKRSARFRTVMALALTPEDARRIVASGDSGVATDEACYTTDGALYGTIATGRRGSGGFGYDPLFIDDASGKTLAEMTPEEKNTRSHRYRALVEMRELMLRLGLLHEVTHE